MEQCSQSNEETSGKECAVQCNGVSQQGNPGQGAPDPRHSFVLFLENCAPVVNTLNFGLSSPVLLGHPHLQLAYIKTQLALRHLASAPSNSAASLHALLNQALLRISTTNAMFNARGGFSSQRPMGAPRMIQPTMGHPGMNMGGMNVPSMNMNMGMSSINQPSMNLSGMNQSPMTLGANRMGLLGMSPNIGLSSLNPPSMNVNRMGPTGMNQGGMGFQTDLKGPGFSMRTMDSPGSFLGGHSDPMGMKSMPLRAPIHSATPAMPPPFPTTTGPMNQAPPRMSTQTQDMQSSLVNRTLTHSSDLHGKVNPALPDTARIMKEKLGTFGNLSQDLGMKPGPMSSMEMPNTKNRYTSESASSILESFGLSNEDLEELSRYPDEQLTPLNLPNILRDIRLRKVNRTGGVHDQGGGGGRRSGGDVIPSKVIDYGHSSKYQINDGPSSRSFESRSGKKSSKEPTPSKGNKPEKPKGNAMDNKIPTISVSRKQPSWQSAKPNRSNNKTLVGEHADSNAGDGPVNVSMAESSVITIKPDSSPLAEIPVILDSPAADHSKANASAPVGTVVGQGGFEAATGKGNWGSPQTQDDGQKSKRPTPSMMNDYFASSPRIFPHICSLCNVECRHIKDWIKHQNTTAHIESCRKLRQQFPDWNPQVHTSSSDVKKDEAGPKGSRSKSGSPRRARRSGSRHRVHRSRSRSPKHPGRRSRSRSPRRARHSPGKSHSPQRAARSPRRRRRERSTSAPDRKAVDAAVQSFIEASKLKAGEKDRASKTSSNEKTHSSGKKSSSPSKHARSSSTARKHSSTSSHSSHSKKPTSSSSAKSSTSNSSSPRKLSSTTDSKKPATSTSKKPVVSTAARKTTSSSSLNKSPASKAPAKSSAPESGNPLNKLTRKDSSQKIIHVTDLPDSGYTDQDILKVVQPFGKVCDILIVRSKNEAFVETNFREAAAAAVKFSETVPVMINNKRITLSLAGQNKDKKPETKASSDPEPKKIKSPQTVAPTKKPEEKKRDIVIPPGFVKCYTLTDPPLNDSEKCVIEISNLPEKHTLEEVSNLAKPFGGVKDILAISTHQKAFLELQNRNSVDSMIKFYDVFPVYLGGNLLKIAMSTKYKDVKDENRIFAEIIQQASYKINPTIYQNFVHFTNLPEADYEAFDITKIGLRFGKVEHCMVIKNKRKAILHMSTASSAKAMHKFLDIYPPNIAGSVLSCSLSKKLKLAENEYVTYLEEEKKRTESDNIIVDDAAMAPEEGPTESSAMDVDDAGDLAKSLSVVSQEEDEEEAAEAPEAPDVPFVFMQPEPVVQNEYNTASEVYVTEECDVLVSVESDEECEEELPISQDVAPVTTATESEEHDSEIEDCPNDIPCDLELETSGNPKPFSPQGPEAKRSHKSDAGLEAPEIACEPDGFAAVNSPEKKESKKEASNTSRKGLSKSKEGKGKVKHSSHTRSKDEQGGSSDEVKKADATRTAKYNPLKGDISVTLTVDNQKSSLRTPDSRKRSSGDRGSSGRDVNNPKSSSNRSSPSDHVSSNPKGKGNNRDSKAPSRTREGESRSSSRKMEERSKGSCSSSSSRYPRSSKGSSRGPRSIEEEDTFPFNLDEFVTVDEIVEDHREDEEHASQTASSAPKRAKRKESHPPVGDAKKAKGAHDLSFVTLDEVGDEDDANTTDAGPVQKDQMADVEAPSSALASSTEGSQILVTLDEVSDDEDAPITAKEPCTSAAPEMLGKDQLLTLDEVNAEDEEQTCHSEPPNPESQSLPGEGESKEQMVPSDPEVKETPEAPKAPSEATVQEGPSESPLLTLDEVKADEDDESIEDIEHKFLTVDEIGEDEEEEEPMATGQTVNKAKIKSSQLAAKTPTRKRGRPKKVPLAVPSEGSKDTAQKTPATEPAKTPLKLKAPMSGSNVEEQTTPNKSEAGDTPSQTETPAKKTKLESPASGGTKLSPFNSSVPVGLEFLVPKTGYFCELCSLFYMDDASKMKHCKSLRHYQAVQKQLAKEEGTPEK
ncbi:zinc finger protein 638 [Gastrophryne carolinensis]